MGLGPACTRSARAPWCLRASPSTPGRWAPWSAGYLWLHGSIAVPVCAVHDGESPSMTSWRACGGNGTRSWTH